MVWKKRHCMGGSAICPHSHKLSCFHVTVSLPLHSNAQPTQSQESLLLMEIHMQGCYSKNHTIHMHTTLADFNTVLHNVFTIVEFEVLLMFRFSMFTDKQYKESKLVYKQCCMNNFLYIYMLSILLTVCVERNSRAPPNPISP